MPAELLRRVDELTPVGLPEIAATAALLSRLDRKYVVRLDVAEELVATLASSHRALEIARRRAFAYRSVYYDSPSLGAFRAHMQQRRRRYKCRTRHYLDTGADVFEVKLKGARGITVKHQLPLDGRGAGDEALAFARECVQEAYGLRPEGLRPWLNAEYSRVTLAHDERRVTIDFGVRFGDERGRRAALRDEYAIVESKSVTGAGAADLALRRLGVRPVQCSKYCVGVALLRDEVRANSLGWLLRRYFTREAMGA